MRNRFVNGWTFCVYIKCLQVQNFFHNICKESNMIESVKLICKYCRKILIWQCNIRKQVLEINILFLSNFSYFFPIILSKFPNFGILTATIFPKIWTVSRNFTKNFFSQKMSWSLAKQSFSCKIFNCVMMFLSQKVQTSPKSWT